MSIKNFIENNQYDVKLNKIRINNYKDTYCQMNCLFVNVEGTKVASSTNVSINDPSGTYAPDVDAENGQIIINEQGIYAISIFLNNTTVLGTTDVYKLTIEQQNGDFNIYARNISVNGEAIGELNILFNDILVSLNGDEIFRLFLKRQQGSSTESFEANIQFIRIK